MKTNEKFDWLNVTEKPLIPLQVKRQKNIPECIEQQCVFNVLKSKYGSAVSLTAYKSRTCFFLCAVCLSFSVPPSSFSPTATLCRIHSFYSLHQSLPMNGTWVMFD